MNRGFAIVGSPVNGQRRLVDAVAILTGYAGCDPRCPLGSESYLSAFWYDIDFEAHLYREHTVKGFDGNCWLPWIRFDIDREGQLELAKLDTQRLAKYLVDAYQVDPDSLLVYYSGSKGFHLELPITWPTQPSKQFNQVSRALAERLASEVGLAVDSCIYTKTQPYRAPNSRHRKTGLYKRRLSYGQLASLEAIQELAKQPAPYSIVWPSSLPPNNLLRERWGEAAKLLSGPSEPNIKQPTSLNHAGPRKGLNRLTLDYIRQGAEHGDRHRLLFSAAANLGEYDCPPALAEALLLEAALDSGLSPSDARRQIACGLQRGSA